MAEMTGITPPSMNWSSSDLPTAFREFKQYCELIFTGPLAGKTNPQKVTYSTMGRTRRPQNVQYLGFISRGQEEA